MVPKPMEIACCSTVDVGTAHNKVDLQHFASMLLFVARYTVEIRASEMKLFIACSWFDSSS